MPVARSIGQRIAAGWITSAALTSAYAFSALTLQSDQQFDITPWAINAKISTPPRRKRFESAADESIQADGPYNTVWGLSYATFGMLAYISSTYLTGGVQTGKVTIMDYTDENTAIFLQCLLNRPVLPGPDGEYHPGGWKNVLLKFVNGSVAP